ncbi:hypothetical protein JOC34_000573 [Virgibacillus halotolerans]|uniref:hypothetical protein n=1 Tax=Virgibacillus halotolerans TaxID=1071053 RepID=UPI00195FCDCA|nr:hypothetical protein [Virgibacillus halotolerans]MBM7598216.1 hypothetical protein [Virgibacillus halotolerans]
MTELQPTYGNFKLRGIVRQIGLPFAFNKGTTGGGLEYRRLNFMIQTSKNNFVPVELFGMKFDEITITPTDKKDKQRKKITYSDDVYKDIEDGWEVFMGTNVGIEQDEKGGNIKKVLAPFDAIEEIHKGLEDGDSVFVNGGKRFNEYKGDTQQSFEIRSIYHTSEPIDFDAEGFEEQSTFDQTLVVTGTELDKKTNRLIVNANIIYDKKGLFVPFEYFIDITRYKKFALNLRKFKFGTQIKVSGLVHSTTDMETITEETVVTDEWGEDLHQSSGNDIIRDTNKSLEITKGYPETIEEKKYSEDDFKAEEVDEAFQDKELDAGEWGDSDDSSDDDPFK